MQFADRFDNRYDGQHQGKSGFLQRPRPRGHPHQRRNAALTLSTLQPTASYASEPVLWIDIVAGYAANGPEVYSYLDGVTITLVNGAPIVLDLGDS